MTEKKLPKRVEIKFEDLNPQIKYLFKMKGGISLFDAQNLRIARMDKNVTNVLSLGNLYAFIVSPDKRLNAVLVGPMLVERQTHVNEIRKINKEISSEMKHGVFVPSAEKHYPDGWINPSIVGKTHPIFFVKGNGNIVFVQPTRDEYFRWKYQQHKLLGGMGLVVWRWRQEIVPPVVPVKVRELVKARIAKIAAKAREFIPQPMPRPLPVGVFSKRRKQKRKPRLRHAFA